MMLMGVVRFPHIEHYWVTAWPFFALCTRVMSRNRFQEIRTALYFCDYDEKPDGASSFWKVEPLLNLLRGACENVSYPGRYVTVDEMMINCQARTAKHLSVTVKGKPIPFGILVRVLNCSQSKYLLSFTLAPRGTKVEQSAEILAKSLTRRWHVITSDNLYTTAKFGLRLLQGFNGQFPQ